MTVVSGIAGFDVGGQSVKAVLVDPEGKVLARAARPTGPATDIDGLVAAITDALSELGDGQGPVGLGMAGVFDPDGSLAGCPNLPRLAGTRPAARLESVLSRTVVADNDANCAALAEGWTGAVLGLDDYLVVVLGSGLGSGLVTGGRVYQGSRGHGCEMGHSIVNVGGRRCGCGAQGCLEAYVSETAVRAMVEEAGGDLARTVAERAATGATGSGYASVLFELAASGDETAGEIASNMVRVLGAGLASAVNSFDVTTLVLGGGMAPAFIARADELLAAIAPLLFARAVDEVTLIEAAAGPYAGAIGAARLVMLSL